jgi:hypothetical protein
MPPAAACEICRTDARHGTARTMSLNVAYTAFDAGLRKLTSPHQTTGDRRTEETK